MGAGNVEKVQGLTGKQRVFVTEYLRDFNGKRAAEEAGYANGQVAATKLLDPEQFPLVAAKVKAEMDKREADSRLTAKYVKDYIHTALDFCPTDWFTPGEKGTWEIDEESYKSLPTEIKRLIEEVEFRQRTNEQTGETTTVLKIRFVSKTAALSVAAKYTLTQKIEATMTTINWDDLYRLEGREKDDVEEQIRNVERSVTVIPTGDDPTGSGSGTVGTLLLEGGGGPPETISNESEKSVAKPLPVPKRTSKRKP